MSLKPFDEYIRLGIVKKVTPDKERAKNLSLDVERKISSLKERIQKIGIRDENANDYVEYCYDILMGMLRSKMLIQGLNASGLGAHESEVAFMRKIGFNDKNVQFADQLRYFRNGILYYGKSFDKEYAQKVIDFLYSAYSNLKPQAL